jgi:hypothetical protein
MNHIKTGYKNNFDFLWFSNYTVCSNFKFKTLNFLFFSVEDHFAKALGETWIKLQEQEKAGLTKAPLVAL